MASSLATLRSSSCSLLNNPPQSFKIDAVVNSPRPGGGWFTSVEVAPLFIIHYLTTFEQSDCYRYFRKTKAFGFLSSIVNLKMSGSKAPPLEGFGEAFYLTTFTNVPIPSIELFISSPTLKVN